jgi:hypothetical protein
VSAETIRPLAEEAEQPQDWLFTFGAEHYLDGTPLRSRYVRFHGTYMEARLKMIAALGRAWCAQYPTEEAAGVERYGLTELILPDPTETR